MLWLVWVVGSGHVPGVAVIQWSHLYLFVGYRFNKWGKNVLPTYPGFVYARAYLGTKVTVSGS